MSVKFGGLDMAMRVDNSALIVLKLEDGVLEQIGQKVLLFFMPLGVVIVKC